MKLAMCAVGVAPKNLHTRLPSAGADPGGGMGGSCPPPPQQVEYDIMRI